MKYIFIIFKKELLEVFRDRRSLMAMIVFPLLLIPSLLSVVTSFQISQTEDALSKVLRVGIVNNGNGGDLVMALKFGRDIEVIENVDEAHLKELVKGDSLDAGIIVAPNFDATIRQGRSGKIEFYHNSTAASTIKERVEASIQFYNDQLLVDRLDSFQLTKSNIEPLKIIEKDVYTQTEAMNRLIGGFLPYFFVIFCIMGAMYPTIDLFTGEKERGTIETILTVPTSRLNILLGKMSVPVFTGVISGITAIFGMYLALQLNPDAPAFFIRMIENILQLEAILLIVLMLIPLTIFFAGAMIPLAVYAKSFKEAQSMIQPSLIVAIFPLMLGMLPSMQLNFVTAFIPILNVALASKAIIANNIDIAHYAVVCFSLLLLAALGVAISIRQFGQESNVLR